MDTFLIFFAIAEAVVIIGLILWIFTVNRSQKKIMDKAGQIVKGKLNVDDIKLNGVEKRSLLVANAFNSIKANLMTFAETMKANVVTLSDSIDVLSASATTNRVENEKIADDAANAKQKTAEQLNLVKANLEAIELNNVEMQQIEKDMEDIKGILDGTVDSSKSGIKNLEGYELDMSAMSTELSNINATLGKFNEDIKKIEEVGDFIIGISGKLRLLALNASVETARAGEAGKGFSVVAKEVNGISVKTREGMDTINKIVKEIIQSSQQVNDSILNCEKTYDQSKDTFADVNNSFRSINEKSLEIQDKMNNIAVKFDNMAKNSDVSKEKAESLYSTSQEISENISEIAQVSEKVSAESSKLSENTEALNGMMSGIERLIGQYNTAIIPVKERPQKPVKIMVISMLDNDFWYGVRRGALYAKKELAAKNSLVEFIPILPGTDMNKTVDDAITKAVKEHYDGFIFPGFVGGGNTLLQDAPRRGVKLMTFNCDSGGDLERVSCLKPDPMEPGRISAAAIDKYLNHKGNVAMIVGDLNVGSNAERRESFVQYMDNCSKIKIVEEISVGDSADDVYKKTVELLRNRNDIDAMMITTGNPISAAKAIEDCGRAGKIKLYTFDGNQEIYSYIKKGIIGTTVSQDAFGQGHDPAIWLYNNVVANVPFPENFIPCRISTTDATNVENLIV